MSLKKKTTQGLLWSFVERFGVLGVSFVVQIVLMRLIAPENFGVIATVIILLQILSVIIEGGFGPALIQRKDISRTDISTAFYLNVGLSLAVMVGLILGAPTIAAYFKQPELEQILPLLALTLCFSAGGQAQLQMLMKGLKFKKLAWISLPATLISSAIAIAMAYKGFEIWALVFLRLSYELITTCLVWLTCPVEIRPNFRFSFRSFHKLSGLSMGILGSNLLMRVTRNLIDLIIARVFGAEQLAYYNRARFFQKAPTEPVVGILNRVLFPVFSEIQDDNAKIRQSLRNGVPMLMFFISPIMFFLIASAPALIVVLLTKTWLPTAEYLRIVPLFGITFSLAAIKSNVIRAKGNGRLIFILSLFRNALSIAMLYFTWQHGIMAMIIGQAICYLINMFLNDFWTSRYIQYPMLSQIWDWLFYVTLGACSALAAYTIELLQFESALLVLSMQTLVFSGMYLTVCGVTRAQGMSRSIELALSYTNLKPSRSAQ